MCRRAGEIRTSVEHGSHRIRIGVVAIVTDRNAPACEALAAHLAGRQGADGIAPGAEAGMPNTPRHGDAGEQFRTPCRPGRRVSKRVPPTRKHAPSGAWSTFVARTSASSARPKVMLRPRWTSAKRRTRGSSAFSTATPSRPQRFDQFPLGARHAVDGIEELDVRVADVGHHADVGPGDGGQIANLAGVVHPDFEHRDARVFVQPQDRERQPDVVVEIAVRLADRAFRRPAAARWHPWWWSCRRCRSPRPRSRPTGRAPTRPVAASAAQRVVDAR